MATAADKLQVGLLQISEGVKTLSSGPINWYIEQAHDMIQMLFDRFCPWKVGDTVELVETIDFDRAPGWSHYAHWLQPGVRGTVREVDAYKGLFRASVSFAAESWVSPVDGTVYPAPDEHRFWFSERQISRVADADNEAAPG